jgi:hypothetical protein
MAYARVLETADASLRLKCGWAQQEAAVKNCGLNAVVVLAPSSLLVAQVRSKN